MKQKSFLGKGISAGLIAGAFLLSTAAYPQETGLSPFWIQLTAPDFKTAIEEAQGVCIVPLGVVEKHGMQLPLGTDVVRAQEICKRAAGQEYALVFPDVYIGQIFEAKHQPGTISYSTELMIRFLDETCKEIARNGLKKIIFVNTHGGNDYFLHYFLQTQLESPRDYAAFLFRYNEDPETQKRINALRKTTTGGHADEVETGEMLAIVPEQVKMDQTTAQTGRDLNRLSLPNIYTGIYWYAQYPNHYAGQAEDATAELGEMRLNICSNQLVETIRAIKADTTAVQLQNEFFRQSLSPLETGEWK
jgi:creatinine amidohydrolase